MTDDRRLGPTDGPRRTLGPVDNTLLSAVRVPGTDHVAHLGRLKSGEAAARWLRYAATADPDVAQAIRAEVREWRGEQG